jgi:hypothetical protein
VPLLTRTGWLSIPGEITELLAEVREGNSASESRLAELVYDQLHGIAARYMRYERPDHTLQATVLVDDAYLHMVNQEDRNWQNRSHWIDADDRKRPPAARPSAASAISPDGKTMP